MNPLRAKSLTRIGWLQGLSIPSDWAESKVKYVAPGMQAGEAITAESIEPTGTYPVYGGNGLRGYTEQKTHHGTRILIGRQGALCGNVHLVSGEYWVSEHAIVVRPGDTADARWLAYLLEVMNLGQYSQTAAQPGIGTAQINALSVPVPPAQEQRVIADYLDRETARIDTLIKEQQRLIEILGERKVAAMATATASGEPVALRRVVTRIRQGWSPNCESWPPNGVTEWGVLKVGCSNSGTFDPTESKRLPDETTPRPEFVVEPGEIVMSRANTKELVGASAVVDCAYPRLMLSDLNYGLTVASGVDPEFVSYALRSGHVRYQISLASKGTSPSMQKISQRDIRDLILQLPPLDEQRRIVADLDEQTAKIDSLIAEAEGFIELSRERRSALITAAVTGQIDVREVA
ncbi:restriction endonuclease subunit S [Streptomyces violaceus]|uniref:Restriction endonuclease subunit S n=1 Tax=Streptomyces violaceus TaxID=1936 RepID=A0ABZ1NU78_STRVL|nr:restriction endonuclease subunit S [Streptomyces violaceus]